MLRTTALVIALVAVAVSGPALARPPAPQAIKVSLAGKDAAVVKAEITAAAQKVCRESDAYDALSLRFTCVKAAIRAANDQISGVAPVRAAEQVASR